MSIRIQATTHLPKRRCNHKHFYHFYPFKSDITFTKRYGYTLDDSELALTFDEWLIILTAYFKVIKNILGNGKKLNIPGNKGRWYVFMKRLYFPVDRIKSGERGEKVLVNKPNPENIKFKIFWSKTLTTKRVWFYKAELGRPFARELYEQLNNNYAFVSKFYKFT